MNPCETLETERLLLRKPHADDAAAIFNRYSSDPWVTRGMSWPTHRSIDDTRAFLRWSDERWQQWPAGAYLVFSRFHQERLLGGTGLVFHSTEVAETGYILARDAWGQGFATEALTALVGLAQRIGLHRLEAVCHADHVASIRVLNKCGFMRVEQIEAGIAFPNMEGGRLQEAVRFAHRLARP